MEKYIITQSLIIVIGIAMWICYQKGDIKLIKWKDTDGEVYAVSVFVCKGYRYAIFSKLSQIDFLEMYKQLESNKGKCSYNYANTTWKFGRIQKNNFLKNMSKYKNHMVERGWKPSSELTQKQVDKAHLYVAAHITE